jgi:hypothetical protein
VNSDTRTVTGVKRGESKVSVFLSNGDSYIFNVKVDYSLWQWLLIIFLFGWIWYI